MQLTLEPSRFFQERYVPADSEPVGLAALVQAFQVQAPVRTPCCVSHRRFKESIRQADGWRIFDSKYSVDSTVQAHLNFALRHETVDLLVLKRIFQALPPQVVSAYVQSAPTGPITRRMWFLFEELTGQQLAIPDGGKVAAVDLLDRRHYFTSPGTISSRHKVRDNLLGSKGFRPILRRTEKLERLVSLRLSEQARQLLDRVSPQMVARAASFLLLADSQASFAIEGERLPRNKEERWLRAVQQVGRYPLSFDELNRLHNILIEDRRFVKEGLRDQGVFLGQRSPDGVPLPEFIGARPQDLPELVRALIAGDTQLAQAQLDPVLHAACLAFSFIYIHPYEDGNGRLHRCLIHHVLAERKFSPSGLVFPVSSVMLKRIDQYRQRLQAHSGPLMPFIHWLPTERGNVDVDNDTSDLYR